MAAALVVLVFLDTFATGALLVLVLRQRRVVTQLAELQQAMGHDLDVLGGRDG